VDTGARWLDHTVVVKGNRIATVGAASSVQIPAGARVVDGRGKFLIPGIWDMHVHALFANHTKALPFLAAMGITGIRDMASPLPIAMDVRKQHDGIWPRLVLTGPGLDGVPFNGQLPAEGMLLVITTPEQGRQIVDQLAAAHVDMIKVRNGLTNPVFYAIAEEAKRWGLRFTGHLAPGTSLIEASDAGQDVEHLPGLRTLCAANPADIEPDPKKTEPIEINRAKCEETARHLVRNGTWFSPTIGGPGQGDKRTREFNGKITLIAAQAGVQMLAGTDWNGRTLSTNRMVHYELQGLVEAGLTPQQALRIAIVNPPILLNMTRQLGSIEEGKLADMVLLDADPLLDISNTMKISVVVANGQLIDSELRKKLLSEASPVEPPRR